MRTRGILSIAIIAILLGSLIPITNDIELDDVDSKFFANSEPELLIQAEPLLGTLTVQVLVQRQTDLLLRYRNS